MNTVIEIAIWTERSMINPLGMEPMRYAVPWHAGESMQTAVQRHFPHLLTRINIHGEAQSDLSAQGSTDPGASTPSGSNTDGDHQDKTRR